MGHKFRFDKQFDYTPTNQRSHTRRYKPNKKPQTVNADCAKKAVAAGVGELVSEPAAAPEKPNKA